MLMLAIEFLWATVTLVVVAFWLYTGIRVIRPPPTPPLRQLVIRLWASGAVRRAR